MAEDNSQKVDEKTPSKKLKRQKKAGRPRAEDVRTFEQIEQALIACAGVLPAAASKLKITRQGLYKRIDGSPELQAIVTKCRRDNCKIAEGHLVKALRAGDLTQVRYYLEKFDPDYTPTTKLVISDEQIDRIVNRFTSPEALRGFRDRLAGVRTPAAGPKAPDNRKG